jgi:hypothetical protein
MQPLFHISKMPLNTNTATGKDVSRVGFMALNVANRSELIHIHNSYDTRTMKHHDSNRKKAGIRQTWTAIVPATFVIPFPSQLKYPASVPALK